MDMYQLSSRARMELEHYLAEQYPNQMDKEFECKVCNEIVMKVRPFDYTKMDMTLTLLPTLTGSSVSQQRMQYENARLLHSLILHKKSPYLSWLSKVRESPSAHTSSNEGSSIVNGTLKRPVELVRKQEKERVLLDPQTPKLTKELEPAQMQRAAARKHLQVRPKEPLKAKAKQKVLVRVRVKQLRMQKKMEMIWMKMQKPKRLVNLDEQVALAMQLSRIDWELRAKKKKRTSV